MSGARLRLWSLVVTHAQGAPVTVGHVCAAAVAATGVEGAAVTVTLSEGLRETMYASDMVAADVEELTLTLGEGPGVDVRGGGAVLVADLAESDWQTRWPVFAPAAAQAGVGAVFALPLQIGAIRVGVLTLYRAVPGGLRPMQLSDALMLADTACALLLDDAAAPRPRHSGDTSPEQVGPQHPEVHQATGMISVQLGVTATVALIRLRASAYAQGRRLHDVAGDVVARRLRFSPDGGEQT
jgi:hypothetical protein